MTKTHVPSAIGRAAFSELDRVPWGRLRHAYGKGRVGDALHEDVEATLRAFGEDDEEAFEDAANTVFSNLCHQGTIYEATAYAVPFLAAFAAGAHLDDEQVTMLSAIFVMIAIAASYEAESGSHAGSFGPGVGPAVRAAFRASDAHLSRMGVTNPGLAEVAAEIRAFSAEEPPRADAATRLRALLP